MKCFIAISIAAFMICLVVSVKLFRAAKTGCAIWVMLHGPFGIVALMWLVMFIVGVYQWSSGL